MRERGRPAAIVSPNPMLHPRRFNPALRRLLQLDRPAPRRPEQEITAEVYRNYRWNFGFNLLDVATFWFGMSFLSSITIVPLFISKLTDSPFPIGLAAVIAQASWYLPQLFTANYVERLARKKPVVVNLGLFSERLPLWLLAGSPLLALWSPAAALIVFLLAYAWHGLGAGLVATAWQDLLARCFPVERRGRFMGLSFFVGTASGVAAAGFSARLLAERPFPTNFFYSFVIAAAAVSLSWLFLAQTREPAQPSETPRQKQRQYLAELPGIVRGDDNFRHFLVARLLLALSGMGAGFLTVAAVARWQVADSVVGTYTLALLLGQLAGNLAFGFLADRHGHKLSLEVAGLLAALAFGLAWLAPGPEWYYLVFGLHGAVVGAILVSGIMIVLEFARPARRPTYTGLTNTSVGLVSTAGPLLGSALALVSYQALFALSALAALAALVAMRWWVREPRGRDAPGPAGGSAES
ncbi:MAG: MFS transporter [Candidatus Promineifilaceae bacterium]